MAAKKKTRLGSLLITNRPSLESAEDISDLAEMRHNAESAIAQLDMTLEEEITMDSENQKTQRNILDAAKTFVSEKNRLIFFGMVFGLLAFALYLVGQGKLPLPTVTW